MAILRTFLFTDIENSTSHWESHPDEMQKALVTHDELLKQTVESHNGRIVKNMGDGIIAVFDLASDGVSAALAAQQALAHGDWPEATGPLKVRMGLNTGESHERDGDYFGPSLNLAARVMAIGHGGQVLLSENTAEQFKEHLPKASELVDQGEHRLKGIAKNAQIFQLNHPDLANEYPPLKSLAVYKHNLPVQRTSFIGREKELEKVKKLLADTHLLTLLGPGGTGKTRLTLQVAEEVIEDYADGVWLVELAALTDSSLIADQIANALRVQEQQGRSLLDALVDYLRPKELLLLIDNVEHMVRDSAKIAEYLLDKCPNLTILVTGREALFIDGETTIQIPSLGLPDDTKDLKLEDVREAEGVQLFVERAKAVRTDFELTQQNIKSVVEIVERLDGIPLALELAASRLRMMTVEQIAERLSDRFRLLTGGRRTAMPRQQTLQALIDWSWNILGEKEQILLMRLSVFGGSWSVEGAQKITSDENLDEFEVFDNLEQLVNKSLVKVEYPDEGEARYRMLESIRQYAQDKLFEAGEGEQFRNRHADYYVEFAKTAGPELIKQNLGVWIKRLNAEIDNLRMVMSWTREDRPLISIRIAGRLMFFNAPWITLKEAREWLEPAVKAAKELIKDPESGIEPIDLARVLLGYGVYMMAQGRIYDGLPHLRECIQLSEEHGFEEIEVLGRYLSVAGRIFGMTIDDIEEIEQGIATCKKAGNDDVRAVFLIFAFYIHTRDGNPEKAQPYYEEGVKLMEISRNPRISGGVDAILSRAKLEQGDVEGAKKILIQAIEDHLSVNHQQFARMSQSNLAHILRHSGEFEEAKKVYRETILGWQEQGQLPAIAHQLECYAYLAIVDGDHLRAAKLLGVAMETRERLEAKSTDPVEIEELQEAMDTLAEALGEAERDAAISAGRKIELDDAVLIAIGEKELP